MKRFKSPDSLAAAGLASISPPKEDQTHRRFGQGYSREFQAMLDSFDEEDFAEEGSHLSEKKRRLTLDQVKALEKNFEVENKLEPERKLKLAEELGLQPRQVAIWFQNRRARWKTKQLERDYNSLKSNYELLKGDYSKLQQQNEALSQKIKELKSKLGEENADSSQSGKDDFAASDSENNISLSVQSQLLDFSDKNEYGEMLNGSNRIAPAHPLVNWIQISDSRSILGNGCQVYQSQAVKVEDHSLFSSEDSCNFLSVDQAPTLHWYFPDQ